MEFTNTYDLYIKTRPFLYKSIAMHVDLVVENQMYFPIRDKVYFQFNPIKNKIQREIKK